MLMILVSFYSIRPLSAGAIIINGGSLQMGDNIAEFCLAKVWALKYGIPFYYNNFIAADLFMLSVLEQEKPSSYNHQAYPHISLTKEDEFIRNKDRNVVFYTNLRTKINDIRPEHIAALKKDLQLREIPHIKELPDNIITVAVHIRKGNGGGKIYDGELASQQEFEHDRTQINYRTHYENFPFDWYEYERHNGTLIRKKRATSSDQVVGWETKFPPNQFFIDQIVKLSNDLQNSPLFVTVCTDDKNPDELIKTLKQCVNKPNVYFDYENERHLPYLDQMWHDLYRLSRTNVLIRSQSYFSRTAELMGNHKVVIYPLRHRWSGKKLIMHEVVIKGSIQNLQR